MSESSTKIEEDSLKNALERQKNLQRHFAEVRQKIDAEFDNVSKALEKRREILVRQFEALQRQQLSLLHSSSTDFNEEQSCVTVEFTGQTGILEFLTNFGGIRVGRGSNIYDIEPCKLEEFREREFYFDKEIEGSGNTNIQWNNEGRVEESDGITPNLSIECISNIKEEFVGSSPNLSVQYETCKTKSSINNDINANSNEKSMSNDDQCESSINLNDNECTRISNNSNNNINSTTKANSITNQSTSTTDFIQTTNSDNDSNSTSNDNNNTNNYTTKSDVSTIINSNTNSNEDNTDIENNTININSNCELNGAPSTDDNNQNEITSNGYEGVDNSCETVNSNGKVEIPTEHPEQVKQWLEQILLETDLEPSVNEVERMTLRQALFLSLG